MSNTVLGEVLVLEEVGVVVGVSHFTFHCQDLNHNLGIMSGRFEIRVVSVLMGVHCSIIISDTLTFKQLISTFKLWLSMITTLSVLSSLRVTSEHLGKNFKLKRIFVM